MKKYHLYLWIIALVGLMTACSQDEAAGPQNKASTRVRIGTSINQALQTRATSVNIPENHQLRYVLEVWSTTESPACIHRDEETATTADAVVFDFTLSESGNYKALLWADFVPTGASTSQVNSPNSYTHYEDHYYTTNSAEGLKAVELAKTRTNYVINDEARDAFFACIAIEKGTDAFEKSVELTRPFGQINVIEKSTDLLAKVATMTLEYNVPIGFNVETGLPLSNYAAAKPTVSTLPTATDARKANHSGAVVSVLVLILAGLETAFDGDQTALLEILGDELCLLAPCDDVDEIGLTLLALTGKVTVTRNAEAAHIGAALGGAKLGIRHKTAHDRYNIQHNTDSFFVTKRLLLVGNDQAAHNALSDLVHTVELSGEAGVSSEVDHGVDAFLLIVDGVGQTALAPLVDGIDRTVSLDQGLELTNQSGGSLLVESGAGNQHGFVLCHFVAPPFGLKGPAITGPRVHTKRGIAPCVRRVCSDSNLL